MRNVFREFLDFVSKFILDIIFIFIFCCLAYWSISWVNLKEKGGDLPKEIPFYIDKLVLFIDEIFGFGMSMYGELIGHFVVYGIILYTLTTLLKSRCIDKIQNEKHK